MIWTLAGLRTRCAGLSTAMLLAACISLPHIAADTAPGRMPVQIESANGRILSASQSKALLDKRGLTGAQSNS